LASWRLCVKTLWYQLKGQQSRIGNQINDGAFEAMMNAIRHDELPSFYFMQYPPTLKLRWAGDLIIKRPVHRSLWRRWKAALIHGPPCRLGWLQLCPEPNPRQRQNSGGE
jgi:hypothetical protein